MKKNENNAVILVRVSSKAQEDEGYSLDSQLKLLRAYCDQRQLNVVRTFNIAETASKEQSRKIFRELLKILKKGDIYHLTVEKTDRLTRNFSDAVEIDNWLAKDKARRLHSVKENLLLHKEARSDVKFMWNIHLAVAKKFTDNLREEAMKGWAEKLAQGWLPATPPLGYKTVVVSGKRIHIPDPEIKHHIKYLFDLYLEPGQSIITLAKEMQVLGLTTRKGHPFCKSHVHRILSNPFYIGINRMDGKEYPGAQEHIISKDVYNKVQVKMRRKLSGGRYRKHNPVLKNVITCGSCSRLVSWQLQKGQYYGACQRNLQECKDNKLLREDMVEQTITSMLEELVSPSPQLAEWLASAMRKKHKENSQCDEAIARSIQLQITRIERMADSMYDDKLAGEITAVKYEEKKAEFNTQCDELNTRLAGIDQTSGKRLEQGLVLLELSQKASYIYGKCTPNQKRIIITKLFDNIIYKGGVVSVKYTNFAHAIANNVLKTNKILGGTK